MRNRYELLAPAGSLKIAKAVLNAGADAVYLAGNQFGARAYAGNFSNEELLEIIRYAHLRNKKIFLTVNTLLKNKELTGELYDFIAPLYECGLDAVIVQDFGVIEFLHRHFPDLDLHASTQMSICSKYGAEFLKKYGVTRIVTARELSLSEIKEIYDATGLEIETFVHGALCYSFSGQCLMSSVIGGRSGNRGRCAQPCRLPYKVVDENNHTLKNDDAYPLSLKDLCTINDLPEMCNAGVYSFKIEGRMKQIDYAVGVVSMYRKHLDMIESKQNYRVDKSDYTKLLNLGNRSGFTSGYLKQHNSVQMLASKDPSHTSSKEVDCTEQTEFSLPVSMYYEMRMGEPATLTAICGEHSASVAGNVIEPAQKQPMTEKDIVKRLRKTGDTCFQASEIDGYLDQNVFMPIGAMNELRRNVLELLEEDILKKFQRSLSVKTEYNKTFSSLVYKEDELQFFITISRPEQLEIILDYDFVTGIDIDFNACSDFSVSMIEAAFTKIKNRQKKAGIVFPYVFRCINDINSISLFKTVSKQADRIIARNYDSYGFIESMNIKNADVILDGNVYSLSKNASESLISSGATRTTVSLELNQKELQYQNVDFSELFIYTPIPMMISAQCIYKNYDKCNKHNSKNYDLFLIDRKNNKHFVKNDCNNCFNIIYHEKTINLLDKLDEVISMGYHVYRLHFERETSKEIKSLLDQIQNYMIKNQTISYDKNYYEKYFSRGHFNRGIE